MRNLFGEGRHPDAERLENAAAGRPARASAGEEGLPAGAAVRGVHRVSAPEFIQEIAQRYIAYNCRHGEHWKTPVPAEVRARIRTEVGNELFRGEHGRAPIDDRERAGFLAKATRQQTTAVAGYDLTFTPVKSVSTLWALADRDVAKQIEDAHHSAVEATLAWLETEVLFTRRGRGGVQQVKARGLIAAMFTHRDARSGDPHLHTHVAVSNKVQDATGRWLAVDGRVRATRPTSPSRRCTTPSSSPSSSRRLGVRFAARGQRRSRERQAAGARDRRRRRAAGRALVHAPRAIEARRRDLAAAFQARARSPADRGRGRHPRRAGDQTRQAKHAPRARGRPAGGVA